MSGLEWDKLRKVKARNLVRALERDGFIFRRSSGSHRRYVHSDGRRVTLSFNQGGDTFAPKTLKNIIVDQARWGEADLERLGMLK